MGLAVRDVDLEPPAATRARCVTVPLHCESERVQGRAFRALVFSEVAGFVALPAVCLFPPCSVSAGSSGAAFFLGREDLKRSLQTATVLLQAKNL